MILGNETEVPPVGKVTPKGSEFSKGIRSPKWPKHSGQGFFKKIAQMIGKNRMYFMQKRLMATRNPGRKPVEVGSLSVYLPLFTKVLAPSQVVIWDF